MEKNNYTRVAEGEHSQYTNMIQLNFIWVPTHSSLLSKMAVHAYIHSASTFTTKGHVQAHNFLVVSN